MPSSVVKEGLLTESNCAITEEQLNAIIRRGQQITDFYEQEKDCFASMQRQRIIGGGSVFASAHYRIDTTPSKRVKG
ncbi:hypothetical protein TYRP_000088 [Tyrophagus putrescentiae]|nr:hypothetical protein TYRP_000088 [Tyrophagus putrescentiae]